MCRLFHLDRPRPPKQQSPTLLDGWKPTRTLMAHTVLLPNTTSTGPLQPHTLYGLTIQALPKRPEPTRGQPLKWIILPVGRGTKQTSLAQYYTLLLPARILV